MKSKQHTLILVLLGLLNILFIGYYVVLCFNAGLHYDDYNFLCRMRDVSILDNTFRVYFEASGRFVFYITNAIMYKLINFGVSYHIFPLIYWLIGVALSYYVARHLVKSISKIELLLYVLLFYNLYILTAVDFAVFYWLAAIWYYLLPPFSLALFYLLNKEDNKWYHWIGIVLLSIAVGGGNEAFTPVVLVGLLCNGLLYLKKYNWSLPKAYKDKSVQNLTIAAAIVLVCFIVVVIAPGNYNRMEHSTSEGFHTPVNIYEWIMGFAKAGATFFYFQSFYLIYYIILFIGALIVGYNNKNSNINFKQQLVTGVALYVIYFLCSLLPIVFVYGGFGIQRLYTHIVFFTMVFICYLGYLIGTKVNVNWPATFVSQLLCCLFLIAVMTLNIINDIPVAQKYKQSFEERNKILEQAHNLSSEEILYLEPLYHAEVVDSKYFILSSFGVNVNKSWLFYQSDVDSDSYITHIKNFYNIKASIEAVK